VRREIEVDEAELAHAMEANDATDEQVFLEEALQLGLRIKSQAGIRKLRGTIEWDGIVEGKPHHEYQDWSKDAD
jgi:hypothetical protein